MVHISLFYRSHWHEAKDWIEYKRNRDVDQLICTFDKLFHCYNLKDYYSLFFFQYQGTQNSSVSSQKTQRHQSLPSQSKQNDRSSRGHSSTNKSLESIANDDHNSWAYIDHKDVESPESGRFVFLNAMLKSTPQFTVYTIQVFEMDQNLGDQQ